MADCIVLPSGDLLPVGFRFHPTDEELINHYLKNKMLGRESLVDYIRQVDICKHEPWDLPFLSNDHTSEQEWFFFAAQDLKYSNSRRSNRATKTGYWKSTGKDRKILAPRTKKLIGTKKTLVFYSGRVSNGIRTNWVIHEYQLHSDPQFAQL
ncbi:protein NTM1-like 9, partial [Cucurbita pepo subsp. pepo]